MKLSDEPVTDNERIVEIVTLMGKVGNLRTENTRLKKRIERLMVKIKKLEQESVYNSKIV